MLYFFQTHPVHTILGLARGKRPIASRKILYLQAIYALFQALF